LCACASDTRTALLGLRQDLIPETETVRHLPLKPELRYLLVKREEHEALLVWVGTERTLLCEASVWVSADGVVMRLCQGRLVGVSEVQRQWQLIDESAPLAAHSPVSHLHDSRSIHKQTTDAQPGYHLGMVQTIEKRKLTTVDPPWPWVDTSQEAQWIEEVDPLSGKRLTVYAVNSEHDWMAGQRCITPAWCVQWQTWPAKSSTSPL
jgi:hypothetical protein